MSTKVARPATRPDIGVMFVAGLLALSVSGAGLADATDNARSSESRHIVKGGRENPTVSSESTDQYEALVTAGPRSNSGTRGESTKPGSDSEAARSIDHDFWIYDADVILFNDDDHDGYYHGIDLLFDADTIYSAAEVYAVLYLSLDFGPWNEYAVTEDFWIFGASGADEYVLVTELMSGYPTGSYDLLIELFDADEHIFLASFGPENSSALSFLPLEDFDRDAPSIETPVAISHGGGGAADGWTIAFLLLLLFVGAGRMVWRHRNDELLRIDSPARYTQAHSDARRGPE